MVREVPRVGRKGNRSMIDKKRLIILGRQPGNSRCRAFLTQATAADNQPTHVPDTTPEDYLISIHLGLADLGRNLNTLALNKLDPRIPNEAQAQKSFQKAKAKRKRKNKAKRRR